MLIGFVGDLRIDRKDPDEPFERITGLLREPDILFGNLETAHSDEPEYPITLDYFLVSANHNLEAYARAGFDVLSLANNHILDGGHRAMIEGRERLRAQGVETCGAGKDLAEARRPAILERAGTRVGFLAYASNFPMGYEARSDWPGLAPLRAYNHFYEFPAYLRPGYLPTMETIPDAGDHDRLRADIADLRRQVDVVVTSFHWGDHYRPYVLTDHERRTARLCIDSGADVVVGHHHHALRGVEWYEGKPIFYGLGNFVFDVPEELRPDASLTMLAWVDVRDSRVVDIGFVPCRFGSDGRVVVVDPAGDEGREVVAYLEECISSEELNGAVRTGDAPLVGGHRSVRVVPAR